MNVLFLHRDFPAQFVHIAAALGRRDGVRTAAVTDASNGRYVATPTIRYALAPNPGAQDRLTRAITDSAARGEQAARAMLQLRADGFTPDLVLGHLGWGETLFVRDVWPTTRLAVLAEYFYSEAGADIGFDPEFDPPAGPDRAFFLRMLNAPVALALADADRAVAATAWQAARFPAGLREKITVMHEGIDTGEAAPDPSAHFVHAASGLSLTRADEVVTFVSRNLEPYRGYHRFMRALPDILRRRPNARAVIVGSSAVSYGHPPPGKTGWKETILDEVRDRLPLDRVHFLGRIERTSYLTLLAVSRAHVHLTYPFILSWSLLEAMSAGALVIASDTAPVREVVAHGRTGLLVDFFDTAALAEAVVGALADPGRYADLRHAARETVIARYDLSTVCLPRWLSFVEEAAGMPLPA